MTGETAIAVDRVSKLFRMYRERNDSLKAMMMRRGRGRYEEFWALNDVSFDVREGSTFGLVGENGSGKSTLLKCITRILQPDKGEIRTRGRISALLELGAGFHPELSGRENVFLNGSILGLSNRQLKSRFDEIVAFAGLEQFIDAPVKSYSSGMYVRLGFSVAINVDPDILLIDEVLAVGDAEFQRRCQKKFADLRNQGRTIVIVTHALGTVREFCDEAVLLDRGHLRHRGSAKEVVEVYLKSTFPRRSATRGELAVDDTRIGVKHVEMLDERGRRLEHVRTGDAVTLRLHYTVPDPIEQPVFGVAVHSLDGLELVHATTSDAGVRVQRVEGSGCVDLRVDRLPLLPGEYDLTAAVADKMVIVGTPEPERVTVEPGTAHEQLGVLSLCGVWDVSPNGSRR